MRSIFLTLIFILVGFLNLSCKKDPIGPTDSPLPTVSDTTSHEYTWRIDTLGTFQSGLKAVWGTDINNVYAAGIIYLPDRQGPTNIMHWDGKAWTPLDYLEGDINAIFGFNSNDFWMAGGWSIDNNLYALISHWDGKVWKTWKLQEFEGLLTIWGTSYNNMWASGYNGTLLHFDGIKWIKVSLPSTKENLFALWGVNKNEIYAAGQTTDFTSVILKYNGSVWTKIIETPYTENRPNNYPSAEIESIWASKSNAFYIDEYVGHDSTWSKFDWPRDKTFIEQIRGTADNNIFAVGDFDLIMHYNGKTFKRYDFYKKPFGGNVYDVWVADRAVVAVGRSNYKGIVYMGKQ